ncbi:MAG: RNA methyltransferase, partial [Bacteroidales bacterium]
QIVTCRNMLSKNKIKHFRSLRLKKYRDKYQEYIVEGEKVINELLGCKYPHVKHVIGTEQWINENFKDKSYPPENILTTSGHDLSKISSFKTPPGVIAVLHIPEQTFNKDIVNNDISLVLDKIQDPGNLGNIIRIADWFGIENIFCSHDCADRFNPKVIQATMGAFMRVNLWNVNLTELLEEYSSIPGFNVYGAFLEGESIYEQELGKSAFIVMGNESRGISKNYIPYIKSRLFIPNYSARAGSIDSLNVSAATAVICSEFRRRKKK